MTRMPIILGRATSSGKPAGACHRPARVAARMAYRTSPEGRRADVTQPPPILPGRRHRPGEEGADWENLSKDYDGSPVLTALVHFSGFLAVFVGSMAALFTIANLRHGLVWLPYALILAALVAAHLLLRTVRHQRRRAKANRTAKPA